LGNGCSNNQAEQATAKGPEALEENDIEENSSRTSKIITDNKIFFGSIKNVNIHSYLIEEIRERLWKLERSNWTGMFVWVSTVQGFSQMN
jgi:hypothetical protein